ncbi:MAG: VPDSG-CTERM sorting domain-containing protein [Verrucomicrobia bacterium]|nr:VPDSG-CTERM sorting domain-containing protein [Verrucomicrobiota bacterium]
MTAKHLKNIFTAASVVAALELGSALRADSIPVIAEDANGATVTGSQSTPGDPRSPLSTLTGGTTVASNLAAFTMGTLSGELGTTVLSGVAENTLGGLTFVYELRNVSSALYENPGDPVAAHLNGEGILGLKVNGWSGFLTNFAMGTSFFFTSTTDPIIPGSAMRPYAGGDTTIFDFPTDGNQPPIFSGEVGYQLILFTNATGWTATDATVEGKFVGYGTDESAEGVATYTAAVGNGGGGGPSGVPDGGTTAILLGAGLLSLGFLNRRSSRQA